MLWAGLGLLWVFGPAGDPVVGFGFVEGGGCGGGVDEEAGHGAGFGFFEGEEDGEVFHGGALS